MARRDNRSILLGTIWVCQCCTLDHANGECCPDNDHGGDGIPPWADTDFTRHSVTMGLSSDEHADTCDVRITGEWPADYECDCERTEYSSSSCDGCGSYLAGERHAFGLWRERQRFARRALP